MTASENTEYVQKLASIGVPGAWIAKDDGLDPTISKIGGFPQYFYLWQKSKEQITCLSCKQSMFLLAQINAPLMEERWERNIYIFMCCNAKCTKSNAGWKVITHKGPKMDDMIHTKRNKYNNDDVDDDLHKIIKHNNKKKRNCNTSNAINTESFWNNDLNENQNIVSSTHDEIDDKMKQKLDGLNDDFSRLMLMQNQLMNEVTKKSKTSHQNKKKKNKKKQQNYANFGEKAALKKGSFIPFEITFYDEGYYKNNKNKTSKTIQWNNREIDLKTLMDERAVLGSKSSKEQDVNIDDDDNEDARDLLSDYLERISVDKTQCVRYCYGDSSLVPNEIDLNAIPLCEHCGHKKVFEFQIMSAVLCYLEPKQIHHDWLTALVFVCPSTCQQSDTQYVVVCTEQ